MNYFTDYLKLVLNFCEWHIHSFEKKKKGKCFLQHHSFIIIEFRGVEISIFAL